MDEQLIDKAADLDRRFNALSQTVGTNLKSAIVSAADSLVDFVDRFREFDNQQTSTLERQLAELGARRLEIETKILEAKANQNLSQRNLNRAVGQYEGELAKVAAREVEILDALKNRPGKTKPISDRTWTPPPPGDTGGNNVDRARELIADLEHELQLLGATNIEREIANSLRAAGASATEEQRARILALIAAIDAESSSLANVEEMQAKVADGFRDMAAGIIADMRAGASGVEILENALNRLLDKVLNSTLDQIAGSLSAPQPGGSPFVSALIASGQGGLFADGGPVQAMAAGGAVRGPGGPRGDRIPAMLSDGEYVVNAAATRMNRPLLDASNAGAGAGATRRSDGGGTVVNIITPPGDEVEHRRRRGSGGREVVDVIVKRVGEAYGLRPPVTKY
ncbi:MAG: hypothetical protein VYD64_02580 [Pseudomonadota bacterium]|nr:hypothetical protein [Pseudomonadota bacterium]